MTFLNPLDALIPKIPFSFFPDFWVWVTSKARGFRLGRILGVLSIEPFLGKGGVPPEGSIAPPPPRNENPASPVFLDCTFPYQNVTWRYSKLCQQNCSVHFRMHPPPPPKHWVGDAAQLPTQCPAISGVGHKLNCGIPRCCLTGGHGPPFFLLSLYYSLAFGAPATLWIE